MPFDICDTAGNHIGVIYRSFPGHNDIFLIALTELGADDLITDISGIETHVAAVLDCKNMLGKVNRDKLNDTLEAKLREDFSHTGITDKTDFLKYMSLKNAYVRGYQPIEKVIKADISASKINGYLLFDINKLKLRNGKVYLDTKTDYMSHETIGYGPPVFAKIIDYPVLYTDIMGTAEGFFWGANLSDFGGRNHAHTTAMKLLSGNCEKELELPVYIHARKGMNIQLYMEGGKISRVFCDGVVYRF